MLAVLLPLLLLGVQGCIIVPTPEHKASWFDNQPAATGLYISKKTADGICPGTTTRDDVLRTLGEPHAVSPDGRKIAYGWETVVGWVFIGGGAGPGSAASGDLRRHKFLVTEFDEQGIVLRRKLCSTFSRRLTPEEVLRKASGPSS